LVAGASTTTGSGSSCKWSGGYFACGGKSCAKNGDFCVHGDQVFGDSCKSIGGDGSTCPRCATVLSTYHCAQGLTASCSGDETTGVTVTCTATSSSSSSGGGSSSCAQLNAKCSACKNKTAHADCLKTVSASDEKKCTAWWSFNAQLCYL